MTLQQRADAAGQPADHAVLPFDGARQVDGRTLDPDAERCRARLLDGMMKGIGGVDQRLGRDAADIEEGAPQPPAVAPPPPPPPLPPRSASTTSMPSWPARIAVT